MVIFSILAMLNTLSYIYILFFYYNKFPVDSAAPSNICKRVLLEFFPFLDIIGNLENVAIITDIWLYLGTAPVLSDVSTSIGTLTLP
jgi:hypothetical protein